jgi:flagellin
MPLSINTNIASMTAQRSFLNSNQALETSFERLSTGKRINSAVDDAAGLAIGKDLESRVNGLNQAVRNVNDGISMVQIAEGALDEVTTILQRMRDLAVQAASDSLTTTERGYLDAEHNKLAESMNSVLNQAKFANKDLIADAADTTVTIQTGADAGDTMDLVFDKMKDSVLGLANADVNLTGVSGSAEAFAFAMTDAHAAGDASLALVVDGTSYTVDLSSATTTEEVVDAIDATAGLKDLVTAAAGNDVITITHVHFGDKQGANSATGDVSGGQTISGEIDGLADATGAIVMIDAALNTIASDRATLGAQQAQLESTVRNLANVAENTAAAAGRIMDTDYAAETANLTKAQILQQAATSILAQANAQPQAVLSLLQ